MRLPAPRTAALIIAVAAAIALAGAEAAQHWGGLVPCALCLAERWPWRIAIVLALLAALLPPRGARASLGVCMLALFAGAALGATHVGVEQGAWPSPLPECAAPHISGATLGQRLSEMPLRPAKPCDSPTYLVPGLPVSMAAMNLGYALLLGLLLAIYLIHGERRAR